VTVTLEAPASPEWDLVERAKQGDAEAFGMIYDLNVNHIYRYILFKVGGKRELAEDLTADTFYRALKRIGEVNYQGKQIVNWLFTIARNLVIDHYKKCDTRLAYPVPDMPVGVAMHGHSRRDPEANPDRTVLDHLAHVELLEVVNSLHPDQREALILRFLMDRTIPETAQIMGKREGAIKSLTYRGIRSVRRLAPHLAETPA
jgi:RNA polymerase sigma-70 factor (ECF subfamily)